jgi:hypothetical protein
MMKKLSCLLPIILIIASCSVFTGDEIGRLCFECNNKTGTETIEYSIELKKADKISFWTETEMEYGPEPVIYYRVEIMWAENDFKEFEFDIFDVNPTMNKVKTSNGSKTKNRFNGKMGSFDVPVDAKYTFKVTLCYPTSDDLNFKKADFVLRK